MSTPTTIAPESAPGKKPPTSLRVDKWLWAARLYKTRSLASAAIDAGHVKCGGHALKPAREIRSGDMLEVTIGSLRRSLVVRRIATQRGPASEAATMYEETPESLARRAASEAARRLAPTPGSKRGERPTKKARRLIHRFRTDY